MTAREAILTYAQVAESIEAAALSLRTARTPSYEPRLYREWMETTQRHLAKAQACLHQLLADEEGQCGV